MPDLLLPVRIDSAAELRLLDASPGAVEAVATYAYIRKQFPNAQVFASSFDDFVAEVCGANLRIAGSKNRAAANGAQQAASVRRRSWRHLVLSSLACLCYSSWMNRIYGVGSDPLKVCTA